MGMMNEEREKHIRIANMLIGVINDLERPMLMYQIEKDVAREALENYVKMLEQQPCEDCISRESLKQKLQEHRDFFINDYSGFRNLPSKEKARVDEIDNCIAMVVNESSVTPQQTRWIPVSERLPQTDGVYIVTRRLFDNQIDTEPYYMVDACYFDGSNTWHNDNRINHERNYLTDIISWMPLPEPYKAESEDEE